MNQINSCIVCGAVATPEMYDGAWDVSCENCDNCTDKACATENDAIEAWNDKNPVS